MKIINKIFIYLLLIFTYSYTQIDTTSLSFYPLHDGDYWEYEIVTTDYSIFPFMVYWNYYSFEVIGDSIFPINKIYKIIEVTKLDSNQRKSQIFERIDSTTCNVYRYYTYSNTEFLVDSLKSQIGDSCYATRTFPFEHHKTVCTFIRHDNILNQSTVSKIFVEHHWHAPIEYKLSKGFGLTYLNYYFDFGTFTQHLLYARIDNIEYGTRVNSIPINKHPVINNFQLYQNYPNPFNPITNIQFSISNIYLFY